MMGHQSRQMAMLFVDIESLIPETHLLRKIERMVSFDFIYDLLAPYYPATGRPSVDPVSMFKMLLIGYLYGIKSERRLVEEVQLNIAYRWFCGFELDDTIPNHSTFSKTRTRKWQQSSLFQKAFYEIVKQCIDSGLIDGEAMAADGSYIPANVSRESWINVETEVEQSMQSYLDSLDEELSNQPGFKKPPTKIVRKCRTTSQTDPDSGYINHGSKRGIGYLMEATVDCKHGILTGVDVYSANEKESVLILRHLERQINLGIPMSRLALDRGYETGAVHRGLELLGITGYIPAIQFSNPPEKYGFSYDPQLDAFICPEGVPLTYHRLNCSKSTGKYLRCYQVEGDACMRCPKRPGCFDKAGIRRRVLASSCYPAFFRGHQRVGTPEYLAMMRLRKIWAEGSFSVLKREHCISKIRKRGILAATEECLLAAMALNLKRMAKCHLSLSPNLLFCWGHDGFQQFFCFCQQVPYCTLSPDILLTPGISVTRFLREQRKDLSLMGQMRVRRTGPWVKISCPFSWVQFILLVGHGVGQCQLYLLFTTNIPYTFITSVQIVNCNCRKCFSAFLHHMLIHIEMWVMKRIFCFWHAIRAANDHKYRRNFFAYKAKVFSPNFHSFVSIEAFFKNITNTVPHFGDHFLVIVNGTAPTAIIQFPFDLINIRNRFNNSF